MFANRLKLQATVFVDAEGFVFQRQLVPKFAETFNEEELIPVPIQETISTGTVSRHGAQSLSGDFKLAMLGSRFDVQNLPRQPLDDSNLMDFDRFSVVAGVVLSKALRLAGLRSHRLALVQEGFLPEGDIGSAVDKLLKLTPFFQKHPPFEWDYRLGSRAPLKFGDREEEANRIVTIRRVQAEVVSGGRLTNFERLLVVVDVNTSPQNSTLRFAPDSGAVQAFMGSALAEHQVLQKEIVEILGGG